MKLNDQQSSEFAQRLNALRDKTLGEVGEKDAMYIRGMIKTQRIMEVSARILMVAGFWSYWLWGVAVMLLALAKILDNMEIGHNVLHGQYDWMNDPYINSRHFEWDIAGDANSWKRYHNYEHHTFTNIIGKDRDFGYGLLRLSNDIRWKPRNLYQFFTYLMLAVWFEFGVAYHELAGERVFMGRKLKKSKLPISHDQLKKDFFSKIRRQMIKDYIFYPLLCFPVFGLVLLGNFIANILRNLWTNTIIFCGHFTEEVHTFKAKDCENESQGEWYLRQILGSSNITGNKGFHILTGHLSCQIEHHLFPDIPARHYPKMAKEVEQICRDYGVPYNSYGFWYQYWTVVKRIVQYSFPNSGTEQSSAATQ